jgi:phenylacetate-coenzyme A ligase PaaK-like adenylate-forming protein
MLLNNIILGVFGNRIKDIERLRRDPGKAQEIVFNSLIKSGEHTEYGKKYNFGGIRNIEDFRKNVPVSDYAMLQPYIKRMRSGENNILWNTPVRWFAKSSGTTAGKSKFIPVSHECLYNCHFSGSKDLMLQYLINNPSSKLLLGKSLTLGGSRKIDEYSSKVKTGDLSAIMIHNSPWYAELTRTPSKKTALIPDFEEKTDAIAKYSSSRNVVSFAGVPSWNLVLMNKILEYTGKKHLTELWPDLEIFFHGGVAFSPYIEQFKRIIPSEKMRYMETYNASEGFFAFQDSLNDDSMLLLVNNNIFFEFMPMSELGKPLPETYSISEVTTGVNYAMIISTNAGLWRYLIGDTVKFTSLYPHKIRITGRTAHYINVFGEELIVENAEDALHKACAATNATVSEYTVAPIFMSEISNGAHEWLIEFKTLPEDVELFANILDKVLCEVNSDYEAKRYHNITLSRLKLTALPDGTFIKWMKSKGKLGGQNKIPRLYNSREYADQLLRIVNTRLTAR